MKASELLQKAERALTENAERRPLPDAYISRDGIAGLKTPGRGIVFADIDPPAFVVVEGNGGVSAFGGGRNPLGAMADQIQSELFLGGIKRALGTTADTDREVTADDVERITEAVDETVNTMLSSFIMPAVREEEREKLAPIANRLKALLAEI